MEKTKNELIEEMVEMLDNMAEKGVGHISIDVNDIEGEKDIKTFKSNDSAEGCFSCRIPNLSVGEE
jgi:hypothetical protein